MANTINIQEINGQGSVEDYINMKYNDITHLLHHNEIDVRFDDNEPDEISFRNTNAHPTSEKIVLNLLEDDITIGDETNADFANVAEMAHALMTMFMRSIS